jgi:hypothetical protein
MNYLWKTSPSFHSAVDRTFWIDKGHETEESCWPRAHAAAVNCWISQQPPQSDTPAAIHGTTSKHEPYGPSAWTLRSSQGKVGQGRWLTLLRPHWSTQQRHRRRRPSIDPDADDVLLQLYCRGVHTVAAPTDTSVSIRSAIRYVIIINCSWFETQWQ